MRSNQENVSTGIKAARKYIDMCGVSGGLVLDSSKMTGAAAAIQLKTYITTLLGELPRDEVGKHIEDLLGNKAMQLHLASWMAKGGLKEIIQATSDLDHPERAWNEAWTKLLNAPTSRSLNWAWPLVFIGEVENAVRGLGTAVFALNCEYDRPAMAYAHRP